ncbi:hypothetical protein [Vibrio sp. AND4]|uniref:hypothetical protein n=1 Tax=Vibrio sp. AND4 TaxID=314289 RepID=UPI00015EFB6E|nr:hypothetical protein [Vibrio sp. AND4]EDP60023.1 hypothetical protein AND4_01403 [Vibrio sp. AND4]EDP60039.1 hypothetical protein AND4_01483 [Vibrio sp. AND4]EDP60911.1 hypothetical protein AND4_08324 [Vibrio sp. AND4]
MNEAQIIYYDLLPDYTVSVLVKGYEEWDLLKSMSHLEFWASSEFVSYELVSITNTTYQERVDLGVFDDYCN